MQPSLMLLLILLSVVNLLILLVLISVKFRVNPWQMLLLLPFPPSVANLLLCL